MSVKVTINGPDDCVFMWDGDNVPLTQAGNSFSAEIKTVPGTEHAYAINVYGPQGAAWSATISSDGQTFQHSGHMSKAGMDSSGTVTIDV